MSAYTLRESSILYLVRHFKGVCSSFCAKVFGMNVIERLKLNSHHIISLEDYSMVR